jgi:hypothetical protein
MAPRVESLETQKTVQSSSSSREQASLWGERQLCCGFKMQMKNGVHRRGNWRHTQDNCAGIAVLWPDAPLEQRRGHSAIVLDACL